MSDEERDKPPGGKPGPDEPAAPDEAAPAPPDSAQSASQAAAEAVEAASQAAAEAANKAEAARKAAEAKAKADAERAAIEAAKPAWERDPVPPEWHDAAGDPVAAALVAGHGAAIESAREHAGDLVLTVRREAIAEVARSLKTQHGFTYLVDVAGVDYPKREPRFEVVYTLYSFAANRRLRLKVATDEATPVPTVCAVWRAANWPEREVYDMFGVRFDGHPDMTRILLWEGFNGHPLRKDFPVEGIDTGAAIYPEYYDEAAGPIAGTGTGWKTPKPPAPEAPDAAGEGGGPEAN